MAHKLLWLLILLSERIPYYCEINFFHESDNFYSATYCFILKQLKTVHFYLNFSQLTSLHFWSEFLVSIELHLFFTQSDNLCLLIDGLKTFILITEGFSSLFSIPFSAFFCINWIYLQLYLILWLIYHNHFAVLVAT